MVSTPCATARADTDSPIRSNSQARSAAKSAPLTPDGVSTADTSARRSRIDSHRDGSGASSVRISRSRYGPLAVPNASGGRPPSPVPIDPTIDSDRRAKDGSAYSASMCASGVGVALGVSLGLTVGSSVGNASIVAPRDPGVAPATGAVGVALARGAGSPKPGGRIDSGRS